MHLNPRTPLAKVYLKHAVKTGLLLHEAKHRLEVAGEDPHSPKLEELGRLTARHAVICETVIAIAYELLDGDGFTGFCREAGVEQWSVDEALKNFHADLPKLPEHGWSVPPEPLL